MVEPKVLTWGCREQPDMEELAKMVWEVSNETVHIYPLDTGGNWYTIVIADRMLTGDEVNQACGDQ